MGRRVIAVGAIIDREVILLPLCVNGDGQIAGNMSDICFQCRYEPYGQTWMDEQENR